MDGGQILAIMITAVLSVIGTVVAARYLEKKTDLRYRVENSGDLVPSKTKVPFDISYGGHPVKHLVQMKLHFTNRGALPIENVPAHWALTTTGDFIEFASSNEEMLALTSRVDDNGVERDIGMIRLLNPGETAHFEFLIADDPAPILTVTARSVGVVARPESARRFRTYSAWPVIAAYAGLGLAAGWLLAFPLFNPNPSPLSTAIAAVLTPLLVVVSLFMSISVFLSASRRE